MKYKLVKFEDGRFGVRAWFFGYKYLSLKKSGYVWRDAPNVEDYCKGTQEHALKALAVYTDKGTLV